MTRLKQDQINRVMELIPKSELTMNEMLELIAYYNWDKFGENEVTRAFKCVGVDIQTIDQLIARLVLESVTRDNIHHLMGSYNQAYAWFNMLESMRQYENQYSDILEDEQLSITGTEPIKKELPIIPNNKLE